MKKKQLIATLICVTLFIQCSSSQPQLKDGDIVFQIMNSRQGDAIKLATHSKFTHVGIVFLKKGEAYVLEAVQPVRYKKFTEWIKQGEDNYYEVKRLRNETLASQTIEKMRTQGENLLNQNYDIYFNWSDSQIYCSELVWKIYQRGAGIELCPLKQLKDFDLKSPIVQQIMAERYGKNIPYEEQVVAPSDIYDSDLLE